MINTTIRINELGLIPEFFLSIGILYLLAHGLFVSYNNKIAFPLIQRSFLALSVLLMSMYCFLLFNDNLNNYHYTSFCNTISSDYLSFSARMLIGITSVFFLILIEQYLIIQKINSFEYIIILLFGILGLLILCSANDLITAYLAIELQSLSFYVLAAFSKNSSYSIDSGLKYFILGAFSSGLFLFGSTLIYGVTGSINFKDFKDLFLFDSYFITVETKIASAFFPDYPYLEELQKIGCSRKDLIKGLQIYEIAYNYRKTDVGLIDSLKTMYAYSPKFHSLFSSDFFFQLVSSSENPFKDALPLIVSSFKTEIDESFFHFLELQKLGYSVQDISEALHKYELFFSPDVIKYITEYPELPSTKQKLFNLEVTKIIAELKYQNALRIIDSPALKECTSPVVYSKCKNLCDSFSAITKDVIKERESWHIAKKNLENFTKTLESPYNIFVKKFAVNFFLQNDLFCTESFHKLVFCVNKDFIQKNSNFMTFLNNLNLNDRYVKISELQKLDFSKKDIIRGLVFYNDYECSGVLLNKCSTPLSSEFYSMITETKDLFTQITSFDLPHFFNPKRTFDFIKFENLKFMSKFIPKLHSLLSNENFSDLVLSYNEGLWTQVPDVYDLYHDPRKIVWKSKNIEIDNGNLVLIGSLFIFASLFFKLGLAPFHSWAPDVYENAPSSSTLFFSIMPKISIFVLFLRLFYFSFSYSISFFWEDVIAVISISSIIIGSLVGLEQKKFKSLLVYSSISHMGYLLISFSTNSVEGFQNFFIFLSIYSLSGLAIWSIFMSTFLKRSYRNKQNKDLGDLILLRKSNFTLALILAVALFSMAGLPPIIGFIAKFSIFSVALKKNFFSIVLLSMVFSVISTFFYLRIIKILFFEPVIVGRLYYPINSKTALISGTFIYLFLFLFVNPTVLFLISYKMSMLLF